MKAELADGRILEFPDGTDPAVVQATVKKVLGVAPPEPKTPGFVDRTNAAITGMNRGIAGIAGLPMDTVENVYNLGKAGVGTAATALGRPDLAPELTKGTPLGSQWISDKLNKIGIGTKNPNPEDPVSQMLHTGGTIAGGSMVPGARIGPTAAAAVGGAVAEQIDPRLTGLGAMAPAVATQAGRNIKGHFAGNAAENVKTFEKAGVTPTAGQATESGFFRGLENLISKFPGGTGVMRKFSEEQQIGIGNAARRSAVDAETAGRSIEKGVTGEGGFMDRFRATQDKLYGDLDKHIPADKPVNITNTKKALSELNADIPGAPALSEWFKNAKIQGIEGALKSDTAAPAGTMAVPPSMYATGKTLQTSAPPSTELPYEAMKKLRTLVGREISDSNLASSVPRSKWKALYGAISEDLKGAAKQQGPQAEMAWSRANNYTRSALDRVDSVLNKVIGKDKLPEDIFKTVNPTDPDQANRIRSVMRSLKPEERQIVSDAIINRMGRSTPGKQNEAGDVFSTETFLTNWNKLSPGAKAQVMPDAKVRADLEAVASVAGNIREGSKVFANPSGTAGAVAPYGLTAMAATGNVLPAGGIVMGAHIGARLLTSPKFVNWLATASKAPPQAMPVHLTRLAVIYNRETDPEIKKEMEQYVSSVSQN